MINPDDCFYNIVCLDGEPYSLTWLERQLRALENVSDGVDLMNEPLSIWRKAERDQVGFFVGVVDDLEAQGWVRAL